MTDSERSHAKGGNLAANSDVRILRSVEGRARSEEEDKRQSAIVALLSLFDRAQLFAIVLRTFVAHWQA